MSVGSLEMATETQLEYEEKDDHSSKFSYFLYLVIILLNASIVGCVNGFYIHLSSQSLLPSILIGIQILVAFFKVAWNMVIVPVLSRPMRGVEKIVRVELLLRIINDIILPCIVTALTSPACFQVISHHSPPAKSIVIYINTE